jgi:chemotaxis response regulator CheB
MWFAYTNNFANWHVLKIDQVKEIIAENKLKNKVSALEDYAIEIIAEPEKNFNNAMGQESLTRFDQPKAKKKQNKKRRPSGENATVENNNRPANPNQSNNNNRPNNNNNKRPNPANNKKPAEPRKPIIITKNVDKK